MEPITTDVLVVGGGPAGIGAAIGAAKAGANTLVLEDQAFFGGVAAWGLGMCMNQMRPFNEPRGFVRVTQMKVHQVPYRALVPNLVDGLLAAGRCISATHEGASAGKSMGNCFATGHAAGIAGALVCEQGKNLRDLGVQEIQRRLTQDGVDLNRGGETQSNKMAN